MFSWLGYSKGTLSPRALPKPSGRYPVGFVDWEWKPSRTEHTTDPSSYALARIYYPSTEAGDLDNKEYEDLCGNWIPSSEYLPGTQRHAGSIYIL